MSDATTKKKSDLLYWINVAITVILMFGIGYLEPWGSLEQIGMKVLAIFIGLLYGWTTLGFVFPSMLGMLALALSGAYTMDGVFTAGFGAAQNTVYCILIFIFAAYMDHCGLSHIIANWFISRKVCVGRPWVFTLMIFIAAYVLGATISLFTAILILFAIFYSACDTLGYKKLEKYPVAVLSGVVFSAMLGFAVFPFKAVQIMVLGSLSTASNGTMSANFGTFTVTMFVITVVCLAVYMLVLKFIVRPDLSNFDHVGDMFADLRNTHMNQEQKIAAFFLVLLMVFLFAPSLMPDDWAITQFFAFIGGPGSFLVVLMLMSVLKIKGKINFDFQACAAKGCNWEMLIMFCATMPVAAAMSNEDIGVINFLVSLLSPIFNHFSGLAFCAVFLLLGGLITQVAHNLVLAVMLTPVLYSFCMQMEINPVMMCTLFSFAIATAVATPGGSATAALMFTNDWIGVKNAYKYGWLMAVIATAVVIIVGIPVGSLLFGGYTLN